ncbi:MAG: type II toxin-antitoxin system VapC family toxin [Planctomycetaceae bacterium]|nr:type II toxin-antitoxin system VapC family toxin [Planctomycetaceae bacterium]
MDPALLDTDMLSEALRQRHAEVRRHSRQYLRSHGQFTFSAITRFEIIRGFKRQQATTQLGRFLALCGHSAVLPLTDAIFDRAADLWVLAQNGGHPSGDADLLIAATALDEGLHLVTGNAAHFTWIPSLVVKDWRQP